jgi:NNP family nitrate/nitrite transporter-like MFS transporter
MPSLSGSLLRIPFAAWVDTTGGRKPFLVLLALSILGMAGVLGIILGYYPDGLSRSLYPLLLFFGCLCGCGIATFSVGIGQVSYWYPQNRQGAALGTYAGIGNLAPGVFSLLVPFALQGWGFAGCYTAWLLFLVVGTVLYALLGRNAWYFQLRRDGLDVERAKVLARNSGQQLFPAGSTVISLRTSAGAWKTWALMAIYFTTFGGFIALTAWLPTYWQAFHGQTLLMAGCLTALYSILTSLVRVGGGSLSDRLGGELSLLLALGTMAVGALVLSTTHDFFTAVVGELILGLGMGVANAAVFKLVPQEIPQAVGGAAGWVGGLGAFGGFAIPPIMAMFVESMGTAGYARGFLLFLVLAFMAFTVALALKWSRQPAEAPRALPQASERG